MSETQRHRRSIRLPGRDYSWPGTYFLTICTAQRKCILGRIENGEMRENILGRLVRTIWEEIPQEFPNVELNAFVVMPNHLHGMIRLHRKVPADEPQQKLAQFAKPPTHSISWIVRTFKARVTRQPRQILRRPQLTVWQGHYFERVVRNADESEDVRRYICENPKNWDRDGDKLSPAAYT
jgi:putative transposase